MRARAMSSAPARRQSESECSARTQRGCARSSSTAARGACGEGSSLAAAPFPRDTASPPCEIGVGPARCRRTRCTPTAARWRSGAALAQPLVRRASTSAARPAGGKRRRRLRRCGRLVPRLLPRYGRVSARGGVGLQAARADLGTGASPEDGSCGPAHLPAGQVPLLALALACSLVSRSRSTDRAAAAHSGGRCGALLGGARRSRRRCSGSRLCRGRHGGQQVSCVSRLRPPPAIWQPPPSATPCPRRTRAATGMAVRDPRRTCDLPRSVVCAEASVRADAQGTGADVRPLADAAARRPSRIRSLELAAREGWDSCFRSGLRPASARSMVCFHGALAAPLLRDGACRSPA
jgi:hypothetical protein